MIENPLGQLHRGEEIAVDGAGVDADAISPDQGGCEGEVAKNHNLVLDRFKVLLLAKSPTCQEKDLCVASLHSFLQGLQILWRLQGGVEIGVGEEIIACGMAELEVKEKLLVLGRHAGEIGQPAQRYAITLGRCFNAYSPQEALIIRFSLEFIIQQGLLVVAFEKDEMTIAARKAD